MNSPHPFARLVEATQARRRVVALGVAAAIVAAAWFCVDGSVASAGRMIELAPQRTRILKEVATRVRTATAVAEIHRANGSLDIVLWNRDAEGDGVLDGCEVAVLSFRTRLRALVWYEVDDALNPALVPAPAATMAATGQEITVDEWKLRPEVRASILATDLSDVTIVPRDEVDDGWVVLRIGLKWVKDRADGLDHGMADVAAVMLPRQSKETLQ